MASPMGPPQLPGYSLRVQLFGPTAYDSSDKPIRCFRVVASPDLTVEEFCVEASRIHQINYGEPLALKRVQDDQQFDITQSEIIGNLFTTASTVRFIQAHAIPGREDSVMPTSALRFDPSTSRKHEREATPRVNGLTPANAWKPNKRQRVVDPDEPLPSREGEEDTRAASRAMGRISDPNVIPNSQDSIILGNPNRLFHNSRNVRTARPSMSRTVREIPETPPPSPPPPALLHSPYDEYGSADYQMNQHDLDDDSNFPSHRQHSSPLGEATARAQSHGSNPKAKSYHIQRPTERGTSISTAATSPLSVQQRHIQNGTNSASQFRRPDSRPAARERNGKPGLSQDENSIYENITSDDEEFGLASLCKRRKSSLKVMNSPSDLQGLESGKRKFNTPPSASQRSSAAREQSTPDELPLTPSSKEREARHQQKQQADEVRKARIAALEADQAEETRRAETERAKREEQERIEVEDFQRGEARRMSAIAKAATIEKEREAREKQEAEEERRREEDRVAKEKADEEQRLEEERLAQEKAGADEADRLRKEEEDAAAAAALRQKKTPTPEVSRQSKSCSPIPPKSPAETPGSWSKTQSATPFIPGQKKSALKRTASSQPMRSSSPAGSKAQTDGSSNRCSVEIQMPDPKPQHRRVSFRDDTGLNPTPIRPASRILPPKFATPKSAPNASTPKPSPSVMTPSNSAPKPTALASKAAIAPGSAPRSTRILPPPRTSTGRSTPLSSLGRRITPVQSNITPPAPKEPTPDAARKISPVTAPPARKSITPVPALQENPKSVEPEARESSEDESSSDESEDGASSDESEDEASSDESEEDIRSRPSLRKQPLGPHLPEPSKPADKSAIEADRSDDEHEMVQMEQTKKMDEDETQSHNSSPRDSRSPVVFSQHPRSTDTIRARRSAPPESESNSEYEAGGNEHQVEEDSEAEEDPKSAPRNQFLDDEADEDSSNSGSEDEEEEGEDEDDTEVEAPNSSPPVLPPLRHHASAGINSSKESLSDEGDNTQDEIDQQLTSSIYEAYSTGPASSALIYPPSSSIAPRPSSMKIGVSLSSLNRNKSMLATSSSIKPVMGKSGLRTLPSVDDEDSEASEEESDDSDSDSSDFETPKPTQKAEYPARPNDSDSDSNSDSDPESEDEEKRIREELAREIAGVKGSNNVDLLSPKPYIAGTQQQEIAKERKKKTEKKSESLLNNYKFSTDF